jgi:NAD(P)-dependent dehydrogenase (short-subunit alcohol dehydrogenase family)
MWSAAGLGIGALAAAAFAGRRRYDPAGRVVLITGGSRGLGLALASEFARRGARIAICARDEQELERAAAFLRNAGADVFTAVCDVSDRESVRGMVARVNAEFGRIDILVNNAGEILVAPLENVTIEDIERSMAIMFWGVVYPTWEVMSHMKRAGQGRIAAITSIGGKVSVPHLLPYCCAKFAAVGFCEGLRAELGRHGIYVTTIAPGLMRTGSHVHARFKGQQESEQAWFRFAATSPLTSMSMERAARQIVSAIERGDPEKILTTQANLMARVNGAFPGLLPDLMRAVNRLLPSGTSAVQPAGTRAELG